MLEAAYNSSINADGSAEKENERYLESLDGKISQFKNKVQEIEYDLIDSQFLKGLVDAGSGILSFLDGVIDRIGTLGTLLAGAGLVKGITTIFENLDYVYSLNWSLHTREYNEYGIINNCVLLRFKKERMTVKVVRRLILLLSVINCWEA
jgi:hypothetical protein